MSAASARMIREGIVILLSPAHLIEMPQVGWRLALLCRHEEPVRAEEVALLADGDVIVVLRTQILAPERILIGGAAIALGYDPWPRERIVDDGNLVAQN